MFSKVPGNREGPSDTPNSKEYASFKHALYVTEGHSGPGATENQSHMRAMDTIIIQGTWAICDFRILTLARDESQLKLAQEHILVRVIEKHGKILGRMAGPNCLNEGIISLLFQLLALFLC